MNETLDENGLINGKLHHFGQTCRMNEDGKIFSFFAVNKGWFLQDHAEWCAISDWH